MSRILTAYLNPRLTPAPPASPSHHTTTTRRTHYCPLQPALPPQFPAVSPSRRPLSARCTRPTRCNNALCLYHRAPCPQCLCVALREAPAETSKHRCPPHPAPALRLDCLPSGHSSKEAAVRTSVPAPPPTALDAAACGAVIHPSTFLPLPLGSLRTSCLCRQAGAIYTTAILSL